jgi:hypothetical protein
VLAEYQRRRCGPDHRFRHLQHQIEELVDIRGRAALLAHLVQGPKVAVALVAPAHPLRDPAQCSPSQHRAKHTVEEQLGKEMLEERERGKKRAQA